MASTYLQRSTTTRTNDRKFTYSCWFKRSELGTSQYFVINLESGNDRGYVAFDPADKMFIFDKAGGTERFSATSNFVLRDTSAFYHLVYAVDSTASSNRTKIYINGVDRYSDFTVATAMSQNVEVGFQKGVVSNGFKIGSQEAGSTTFSGLMSHINFVDGLQLDASSFGETDATTGEWKIKTSPTVSEYGNNGFFILKDGNSLTDQSGKGNNFTVGAGAVTKTEDSPSNVFATWNPLYRTSATSFAYGNTQSQSPNTGGFAGISTLGASSGKYYAEFKLQAGSATYEACVAVMVGSSISGNDLPSGYPEYTVGSYGIRQGSASSGSSFWTTAAGGRTSAADNAGFVISDTIGIALDIDNNKVYFSKNGQWNNGGAWNSATPSTYLTLISTYGDGEYLFVTGDSSGGNSATWSSNFGNGYQQTTAVSSAGTNASGNGIFEYDVPTGYTALSTKGLNL